MFIWKGVSQKEKQEPGKYANETSMKWTTMQWNKYAIYNHHTIYTSFMKLIKNSIFYHQNRCILQFGLF